MLLEIGGEDQYWIKADFFHHLDEKKWRHLGDLPYLLAVRRKAVDGGGCTQQVLIMCKVNIATGIELIT